MRLTSRAYTDVWQEQNALAFTVAGAQSAQMVSDFHQVITKAIRDGTTLAEFREDFDAIVERFGWSYRGTRGWRTRVIFETNLRTAYQPGRWQQAWEAREDRPFLRYVAVMDGRTRDLHRQWNGTILPIGADWWRTHYPPNGWGCRCRVQSLSARDMERRGFTVTEPAPKPDLVARQVNTPDGARTELVPESIDPGWAYNVGLAGQSARAAQQALRQVGTMPPEVGAAAVAEFGDAARRAVGEDYRGWVRGILAKATGGQAFDARQLRPDGSWKALGAFSPQVVETLLGRGEPIASAGIGISSQGLAHMLRADKAAALTKAGLPRALSVADVLALPEAVAAPRAVLRQRDNGRILLVFDPADPNDARDAKVVVQINRTEKLEGEASRFNAAHSAGIVDRTSLSDTRFYELLEGTLD